MKSRVALLLAWGLGAVSLEAATDGAGYGPAIAVPHQASPVTSPKPRNLIDQTREEALTKSRGCLQCHQGIEEMHASPNVVLGCVDCHGGNATPDPLTTRRLLEAVRKIGPAAAQDFYRGLAGAKGMEERNEAAVALADCKPEERATNIVILRNLLGDSLAPVRTRAAVSLVLLGETGVQPLLRERLSATDNTERGEVLAQLDRLSAPQWSLHARRSKPSRPTPRLRGSCTIVRRSCCRS